MPSNEEIFTMIAERRRVLADLLDTITPEQADLPSLCIGWTVHQVAAHLSMPFSVGLPKLAVGLLKHRGNFNTYSNSWAIDMASKASVADLAEVLRHNAEHRFTPPGFGPEAPITDICVHSLDIGIPIGSPPDIPPEQIEIVLGNLISPKATKSFSKPGLLDGLALSTTDSSWTHGTGAPITGPSWAIMLAVSARPAGLAALSGDGAALLATRLA